MVQKDKQKIMAIGLSAFLALMLWVYVMGEKNPIQTRVIDNVKVSIENKDYITKSNLVLMPSQDYTISITVSGRIKDLISIRSDDFKLEAYISGYLKSGENDIPVTVKSLPSGISINESDIPKVKVKLDKLATKFVPVNISVKGNAKGEYEYTSPEVKPEGVMISGAKTYVDEVDKVVARVNLENIDKKVTKKFPVEPVNSEDKLITNINVEPKVVDVTIDVAPSKEVPVVVKTTGALSDDLVLEGITSKVKTVKIIGSPNDLSKIKSIETESFDISSIKGTVTKEVKLLLPDGVSAKSDIRSVGVEVKVKKKSQKDFNIPVSLTNKNENLSYEILPSSINIQVVGSEDELSKISQNDITAVVDVTKLTEGEHTLQVKVSINTSGKVSNISPNKVVVKVT